MLEYHRFSMIAPLITGDAASLVTSLLDRWPWRRRAPKRGLVLAGGGVIGGMFEVGALAALEETVPGSNSQNLLELGLRELRLRQPGVICHLIQPSADGAPPFGPSMGFEASRLALRFGYTSTREWVAAQGADMKLHFAQHPLSRPARGSG